MFSEYRTQYGLIKISETVLAKVVADIVMSSYGIVGLTHRTAVDSINTLLHSDRMFKGVIITNNLDSIKIDLDVVLKYGVKIPTITKNLSETIRYRIETTTGIKVDSVNINVQGIRI